MKKEISSALYNAVFLQWISLRIEISSVGPENERRLKESPLASQANL